MYFTYIIRSQKTGRYYVGSTKDVSERLARHNGGKNKSTKPGVPWELVVTEEYQTRQEAYRREFQIKSYKGGEAFKKLIV
jgi:putative endonuclease